MIRLCLTLLILLGFLGQKNIYAQSEYKGLLQDAFTKTPLPFAAIQIKDSRIGTTTNDSGFYVLKIPKKAKINDSSIVQISFLGYKPKSIYFFDFKTLKTVNLDQNFQNLKPFEINANLSEESKRIQSTQMSIVKLDMREIQFLPAIGGEVDLIKAAQLLPGISAGFEGSTGLYIRGGNADQNLVIYDEAPLYEFGHLFGFFSIFNNDVIQDITILKGAFPANYGGRLSSVIDIKSASEFIDTLSIKGGVGLLSSRVTLKAPLFKGKGTVLISGRRTYIDQVAKLARQNVPYFFYDLNGKIGYKINNKNELWYSVYYGKDILAISEGGNQENQFNSNFGYDKFNLTQSINWKHQYSKKLNSTVNLVNTFFSYDINGDFDENKLKVQSKIVDVGLKPKFNYQRNKKHSIEYGTDLIFRQFKPNIISTSGEIAEFIESGQDPEINNFEYGGYGVSKHKFFNDLLAIDYGIRISGSLTLNKNYMGLEPRVVSRYKLNDRNSIKSSYSRMKQYLHRVSSASVVLPTDLWYPVTQNVKPMTANQVSLGYEHLFSKLKTTLTIEGYYKNMLNVIEYKEGANLILNSNFENELLQGNGTAYGTEFLIKKRRGRITGWLAYTLAWSNRQFDELNNGKEFWAKYDRRHDFSSTLSYRLTKRFIVSAVWVYSSGPRFTPQKGQYIMPNPTLTGIDIIPIYSERNGVSLSPTHRLDINFVFKSKPKFKNRWQGEWHIGAYNLYNRASPYQIQIESTNGGYKYTQPGLFGFLPYFSYNFEL